MDVEESRFVGESSTEADRMATLPPLRLIEEVSEELCRLVFSDSVRNNKTREKVMSQLWALQRIAVEMLMKSAENKNSVLLEEARRKAVEAERDGLLAEISLIKLSGIRQSVDNPPFCPVTNTDSLSKSSGNNPSDSGSNLSRSKVTKTLSEIVSTSPPLKNNPPPKPQKKTTPVAVQKIPSRVIFLNPDEGQTLVQLKNIFFELLRKSQLCPKIISVRTRESLGKLVVEVEGLNDIDLVKEIISDTVNQSAPKKLLPSICIYNIDADISNDEVKQLLLNRNNLKPEWGEEVKFTRVFKNKHGGTDRIIAVPKEMYNHLMDYKDKSVYLLYSRHRFTARTLGLRCYKCLGLGHTDKNGACRNEKICGRCGEQGHLMSDCTNAPKCINCTRAGKKGAKGHDSMDPNCPIAIRHMNELKSRIWM